MNVLMSCCFLRFASSSSSARCWRYLSLSSSDILDSLFLSFPFFLPMVALKFISFLPLKLETSTLSSPMQMQSINLKLQTKSCASHGDVELPGSAVTRYQGDSFGCFAKMFSVEKHYFER
jgi:hypothetical protein